MDDKLIPAPNKNQTDNNDEDNHHEGHLSHQEVHSANSWETADLGDKQRNEKFLRLMGASKKEHHGKIVIGDNTTALKRQRKEAEHLEDDLVEQYEQGLEHRLASGKKGHLGLGYHNNPSDSKEDTEKTKDSHEDTILTKDNVDAIGPEESKIDGKGSTTNNQECQKNKVDQVNTEAPEVKKMKFVQSHS